MNRLAILTSVELRHRFVARALAARFPVVAVGYEETGYHPAGVPDDDLSVAERAIVVEHYRERQRQEQHFFGPDAAFLPDSPERATLAIKPGMLNSPRTLHFLESSGADWIAIYGTNLIKEPLLSRWSGRMVNLHLGLSPYYRGTATNFYPLVNGEPEYIGATIHLIDRGIDTGPILAHVRPEIVKGDRPHTIGCKTILAGLETMIEVLERLERGAIEPTPQWQVPSARLYLRKDYHPRQVVELYRRLEAGMIETYADRQKTLPSTLKLVTLGSVTLQPPEMMVS